MRGRMTFIVFWNEEMVTIFDKHLELLFFRPTTTCLVQSPSPWTDWWLSFMLLWRERLRLPPIYSCRYESFVHLNFIWSCKVNVLLKCKEIIWMCLKCFYFSHNISFFFLQTEINEKLFDMMLHFSTKEIFQQ